jgi:tetratricopeptide (TPR) repeat protein
MNRRELRVLAIAALLLVGGVVVIRHYWSYSAARNHLNAAEFDLARHHYESAYHHALAAAEFWPRRGDVRLLAARTCRRAERPDEAKPHLDAARAELGETDDVRLEQQLIPVQKGEATEFVETALRQRANADTDHRELILEALAAGQLSTFRIDLAKTTLDAWLKEQHDDARPYYWRGVAQEQMAGYMEDAAIADYRRAVELDPGYDEARQRLGKLLLKKKFVDEARTHYEELVRRRPDSTEALVGLARARLAQGETDAGQDLLDRALKIDPNNVDGLRERGMLAYSAGRAEEALPLLRKACELDPQEPYSNNALMECLFKLGREKEAHEQKAKYDRLAERQARVLKLKGELQQRPHDAKLLHELGALHLEAGRADYEQTGLWFLQQALRAEPGRPETLKVLADYFDRKGRPEIAAQLRRKPP